LILRSAYREVARVLALPSNDELAKVMDGILAHEIVPGLAATDLCLRGLFFTLCLSLGLAAAKFDSISAQQRQRSPDRGARKSSLRSIFLPVVLHRHPQISTEFFPNNSCQLFFALLLCAQIDREEKLHESIRRGKRG
jgi:hypothetical protein